MLDGDEVEKEARRQFLLWRIRQGRLAILRRVK